MNNVQIGNIYNIGIGWGLTADCRVIKIEKDIPNGSIGDQALMEMIDTGGPFQRSPVSYLARQKQVI